MVSARLGKGAVRIGTQRKAVSQQTEMNWSPVVVVVAARNASYPQGIAPSNATERCSRRWWGAHETDATAAPWTEAPSLCLSVLRLASHLSPGDSSTDGHGRLLHALVARRAQLLRRRSRSRSMCCRATSGGTTLRGGSGGASRAGAGGGADPACLAHALNSPRMARWMMPNR